MTLTAHYLVLVFPKLLREKIKKKFRFLKNCNFYCFQNGWHWVYLKEYFCFIFLSVVFELNDEARNEISKQEHFYWDFMVNSVDEFISLAVRKIINFKCSLREFLFLLVLCIVEKEFHGKFVKEKFSNL